MVDARPYIRLQQIAEAIETIDPNWDIVDNSFSTQKTLFDYQLNALNNAIKILWKYYADLQENKKEFAKFYQDLDIYEQLNIKLKKNSRSILLKEFFEVETPRRGSEYIPVKEIINRMSFWMATGSGKTLVIVKLIDALNKLMNLNLIPKREILFLTYREDLLTAFEKHITEFNNGKRLEAQIKVINLKDYEQEKSLLTFGRRVFVYRSDLITEERKDNKLNFRDYLEIHNDKPTGKWYLILDEAHKGDNQESKRQALFSILAKEGFLFNFSATFTDPLDIVSTVYNFNLNEFINKGYGKQIYLSQQSLDAFRQQQDFNTDEKKKIIIKTFIVLTACKKAYENIRQQELLTYHNPLLIFLVNSVNTRDADLKLVFQQIAQIGLNINPQIFNSAKEELKNEFQDAKYTIGSPTTIGNFISDFIENCSIQDIYKYVFNSSESGNIEYIINPQNKQEIILKLDSSNRPFALIKIGNISNWIRNNLQEYRENRTFEDTSVFETLNEPGNPINILLGSRAFYEGWDSNRPNVISFINIGQRASAKKFVLQSIGRGVRIEPLPNKRQRLNILSANDNTLKTIAEQYSNEVKTLETLFVFATNKKAVETILQELEFVKKMQDFVEVSLWKNEKANNLNLLIPKYKKETQRIVEQQYPLKFRMSNENLELLQAYFNLMPPEKFILSYEVSPKIYNELKQIIIDEPHKFIYVDNNQSYKDLRQLINSLIAYLNTDTETYDKLVPVNDKIIHFKKIKVRSDYKDRFITIAERVREAALVSQEELFNLARSGEIGQNEFADLLSRWEYREKEINNVKLKKLLQHYYLPIVYSTSSVNWIKHIINVESERHFIESLLGIIDDLDNHYNWWMFSKLDEYLDTDIYIPYVMNGKIHKFIPDFIFWLQKDKNYYIIFIDPKGGTYASYQNKIDGFKNIFLSPDTGQEKVFQVNDLKITVKLMFYTTNSVSEISGMEYRSFWVDKDSLREVLLNNS